MLCTASCLSSCLSLSTQNRLQEERPVAWVWLYVHSAALGNGSSSSSGAGDWEWGWALGLTPSFVVAVLRAALGAVDLLLPALRPGDRQGTCCWRPSLDLQGCSELCVPCLGTLRWPARLAGEGRFWQRGDEPLKKDGRVRRWGEWRGDFSFLIDNLLM